MVQWFWAQQIYSPAAAPVKGLVRGSNALGGQAKWLGRKKWVKKTKEISKKPTNIQIIISFVGESKDQRSILSFLDMDKKPTEQPGSWFPNAKRRHRDGMGVGHVDVLVLVHHLKAVASLSEGHKKPLWNGGALVSKTFVKWIFVWKLPWWNSQKATDDD